MFELEVMTPSQNLCRSIGCRAWVTRTQISLPPLSPLGPLKLTDTAFMIANLKTLLGWYRQHPDTELRRRIIDECKFDITTKVKHLQLYESLIKKHELTGDEMQSQNKSD
jgi:hypothetical protein